MITIIPINEVYITSLVIHMFIISDIDTSVTWGVHVYVLKEFIKKKKKKTVNLHSARAIPDVIFIVY